MKQLNNLYNILTIIYIVFNNFILKTHINSPIKSIINFSVRHDFTLRTFSNMNFDAILLILKNIN